MGGAGAKLVEQALLAFGATCALHRDLDASAGSAQADGDGFRLCFETHCAAPILAGRGQVVVEGCAAGGALGATCRVGCSQVRSFPPPYSNAYHPHSHRAVLF